MQRIGQQDHAEKINAALLLLPNSIVNEINKHGVHFFTGCDPIFAGLHNFEVVDDGRSYRNTAHTMYPYHLEHRPIDERVSTIVLPDLSITWCPIETIIHELGHVLHYIIGYEYQVEPVNEYAEKNALEAFAMSFETLFCPWSEPDKFFIARNDQMMQQALARYIS